MFVYPLLTRAKCAKTINLKQKQRVKSELELGLITMYVNRDRETKGEIISNQRYDQFWYASNPNVRVRI